MNVALPPPEPTPTPPRSPLIVWLVTALLIVLILGGMGGYKLWTELQALREAEPVVPPEVTRELESLRQRQQAQQQEAAAKLTALQQQLAALKEEMVSQRAAPGMEAALLSLEQRVTQLAAAQAASVAAPTSPVADATPAADGAVMPAAPEISTATMPNAEPQATPSEPAPAPVAGPDAASLHALRRAVEDGGPYRAELEAARATLGQAHPRAFATLEDAADEGIADDAPGAQPAPLPNWAQRLNQHLPSLIRITPAQSAPTAVHAQQQARRETILRALDAMEATPFPLPIAEPEHGAR